MKKPIFISAVLLLLTATLTVSCNSCDKRQASELPTEETTVYNDTASAPDTISTADADAASPSVIPSQSTAKKPITKNTDTKSDAKTGYSAKDGTDAENNDGDMYTKNDSKPMPSGPPIK